jgi:hypothetical protein
MPTLAQASVEAPAVEEMWVAEVSSSGATLYAKIDPQGNATTYKLEYGEGKFQGSAGAGTKGVVVEAHPQNLKPRTVYNFRVVAESSGGKGEGEAQFTTQSAGGELKLPDGRMWELVSPATKDGALIEPIGEAGGLIQAAESGGAITYLSGGPAKSGPEEPQGNANDTQLLAVRGVEGGWSSSDIATPHEVSTGLSIGFGQEYRWFSPDLAIGLVEPFGSGRSGTEAAGAAPLSESASEMTIYLRADGPLLPEPATLEQEPYLEAESEGGYLPLVTGCPVEEAKCKPRVKARANVPPGTQFGAEIKFLSATPDADHVVLHSLAPLQAGAERNQLYEWTAGMPTEQLQLVSVLPDVLPYNGEQAPGAALGYKSIDASGAVSSDGSRIVWTSEEGHLFMRNMASKQTVQLDVPESGEGNGKGDAQFQFASSDGSKVFFTDGEHLTATSTTNSAKPDLYVCKMVEMEEEGKEILKCDLSDLTASSGEGADVQGTIVPASDEGSYVYFVTNGVLTKEANTQGEKASLGECGGNSPPPRATCNLYVRHYNEGSKAWEVPVFVASLSSEDRLDWNEHGSLEYLTSRVSPNGEYLAFMSERSLTGYDNKDVNSGEPDEEVYLYKAPSAGAPSGRLVCVSCNPTGERPAGVLDPANGEGLLTDKQSLWRGRWLAANVPGWTAISLRNARYQSRYVSNSGRVFFDSSDSLVPQATNGLMDLFEYEPTEVGDCEASSSGFSEHSGGCVGLISSGSSAVESAFLDASASGEDVFFLTSARLASEDRDTAFDVYDAHVCSVAAPCAAEAVPPPACETADSCRVAPSPQPSIFGAPASATFSGPENPVAGDVTSPPPAIHCSKGKRLSHGRCVKVKRRHGKKARVGRTRRDRGGRR